MLQSLPCSATRLQPTASPSARVFDAGGVSSTSGAAEASAGAIATTEASRRAEHGGGADARHKAAAVKCLG